MHEFLKQSTASQSRMVGPFVDDTNFKTAETALTVANTDVKLCKNGAASVNKNSGGGTHRINGMYSLTFDATDTNTVGELTVSISVAGALIVVAKFTVLEEAVYDALFASSAGGYLQPTTAGRTLDVTATGAAGIDWGNVENPSTSVNLSATTSNVVNTATTVTNAVTVGTMNASVINAASIAADAITSAKIATDAIGSDELAATAVNEIADQVWDEDIADHTTSGTFGESLYLNAYSGPYGPGVFIDDGAANTATVAGEDGTWIKPVSTMAAARTIANALGTKQYYLIASDISVDQTTEDWLFIGIGDRSANILNLASQDVDRSRFINLTLEGVQGGTARITAEDCILQDDAGGSTTLYIHAIRCGLLSSDPGILIANNNDHIFDGCYSMVAGNGAPMIDAQSGANVGLSIRHYSGGIELKGLSGTSTTSIETDGQVIFNASNTTTAPVTIRGNCTITDNATMTALTDGARIDVTQINDEVVDALDTDTYAEPSAVPAATASLTDKISWMFTVSRNKITQTATTQTLRNDADAANIATATVSDDTTTFTRAEWT